MCLRKLLQCSALLALIALTSRATAQIADGGFDTQASSVTDFCYFGSGCPTGPWGGVTGFVRQNSPSFPLGAVISPNHAAFVQGGAYISQTFTVPTAGTYRLTWWDAGRVAGSSWGGNETYMVKIGSTVIATLSTTSGQPFIYHSSAPVTLAANTNYTLSFQGATSTDQMAFVDSVNISLASGSSVTTYTYDALGRLTSTSVSGGIKNGVGTSTSFDDADNRTNYTVSGVPHP